MLELKTVEIVEQLVKEGKRNENTGINLIVQAAKKQAAIRQP